MPDRVEVREVEKTEIRDRFDRVELREGGPPGPASTVPGPPGDKGDKGDQGDPGPTTSAAYVHDQGIPSDEWTVIHPLGFYPSVTVVDSGGNEVEGEVIYVNATTIIIKFANVFGGKAYLS